MTQKPQRPRRQRKGDRLLNPDASADQIQCDYGIAPMDRLALEYDRKWGIDRLPELVSPDTASKYGFSIAKLNEAIETSNPELCKQWAAVCMRGLNAMDAEATQLGHKPASGDFWEYEYDGLKFAVLRDGAEWKTAKDARPDLKFFTLREIAVALKATRLNHPAVDQAKESFPKAEVASVKTKTPLEIELNDEIPF